MGSICLNLKFLIGQRRLLIAHHARNVAGQCGLSASSPPTSRIITNAHFNARTASIKRLSLSNTKRKRRTLYYVLLAPESERRPRGGLSEIRSGVLVRRQAGSQTRPRLINGRFHCAAALPAFTLFLLQSETAWLSTGVWRPSLRDHQIQTCRVIHLPRGRYIYPVFGRFDATRGNRSWRLSGRGSWPRCSPGPWHSARSVSSASGR